MIHRRLRPGLVRLVLAASRGWALALGRLTALQINDIAWQMMEKIVQYLLIELERGKFHKKWGYKYFD